MHIDSQIDTLIHTDLHMFHWQSQSESGFVRAQSLTNNKTGAAHSQQQHQSKKSFAPAMAAWLRASILFELFTVLGFSVGFSSLSCNTLSVLARHHSLAIVCSSSPTVQVEAPVPILNRFASIAALRPQPFRGPARLVLVHTAAARRLGLDDSDEAGHKLSLRLAQGRLKAPK